MSAIVMLTPEEVNALVRKAVRSEFAKSTNAMDEDVVAPKRPMETRVYFIRSGASGSIKIGVSMDVQARLSALQTSHGDPLTLLASIRGDRARERELHEQFAHLRCIGEWFRPAPDLLTFIAGLPR